ncbi:MAG: glycosyltransferase family 4 protein [candidate division NC10 bacterium]|nr:glycosyltransferase family 4 protein [candidate division NC10 bacterium]
MNLALVTPYYFPSVRGNSITVQRIESGLRDQGLTVQVFSLDQHGAEAILAGLRRLDPDVVHAFHATAAGPLALQAARGLGIPAVITLTGTDVNLDLFDPARRPVVLEVLEAVQAIVVFHEAIRDKLVREVPTLRPRVHVIGQTVQCDEKVYDLRAKLDLHPRDFVCFQPAGIRRVKDIPFVIPPLTAMQRRHPQLKYVLAGPVIEPEEGERVKAMLRDLPWAFCLGALSHEEICAILPSVDVVINSSLSEGGMSNAVLEAMSKAVPVLASDIEGNRSVIVDGQDGFLFGSEAEFLAKVERLLGNPALRDAIGRRAMQKIAAHFPLEAEIGGHLRLYQSLAGGKGT